MEKSFILVSCAAVLALASCTKDKGPQPGDLVDQTFYATLPAAMEYSAESKAAINGMELAWDASDKIAVCDGKNVKEFQMKPSGKTAEITGQAAYQADAYYAVFPFAAAKSCTNGTASVEMPASQTEGQSVVLLAGKADAEKAIALKNLCGYIEFNVPEGIRSITVKAADGAAVAGAMSVNAETGKVKDVAGADAISFAPASGTFAAGRQLVAIAPVDYSQGLSIQIQKAAGAKFTYTTPAVTMERGVVTKLDSLKAVVATEYTIASAADFKAWVDAVDSWTEDDKVTLECDIDMTEYTAWVSLPFKGEFDGKNHCIYNFVQNVTSTNAGFFGACTGNVSNLILGSKDGKNYDGKSKVTATGEGGWIYVAAVASNIMGNLTNIVNYVPVEIAADSNMKVRAAAIVARHNGNGTTVKNCINYGDVTSLNEGKTDNAEALIGGIIATCEPGGTDETFVNYVKGCKNYGKIESKDPFTTTLAGIVSNAPKNQRCEIDDCHNYGLICNSSTASPTNNKEGYVGGISGLLNSDGTNKGSNITNCTNNADLICTGVTMGDLGGISGRHPAGIIKNCVNNNVIKMDNENAAVRAIFVGGIVGAVYNGGTIEDCTNKGEVSSNKNQVNRVGGIAGQCSAKEVAFKNCKNEGKVTIERSAANANWQVAGGIVGFQEKCTKSSIESCTNSGEVKVAMENNTTHAQQVSAGGIIGNLVVASELKNNVNTGNVSANTTGSAVSYAGGIAGWLQHAGATSTGDKSVCSVSAKDNAGAAAGANLGSIANPVLGGSVNGTALTADNVATLAVGTGTAATGVTLAK